MNIESNPGIRVHYAGAALPNGGASAARKYELARLPGLVVEGRVKAGFSVKGFQVPTEARITAFLGERLAPVIGQWPEAEQARPVHNLLAFAEARKLYIFGANRGIQEALTELMCGYTQVKIAFDTRPDFDPERHPDSTVNLGADMEFRTLRTGGISGGIRTYDGIAHMNQVNYSVRLPAEDLLAILRFQGE